MKNKNFIMIFILSLFLLPFSVNAYENIDDYIISLATGGNSSSFDVINTGTVGTCTNTVAYDNNGTNNIRYVGANPCNYIIFNGEKWRIIGLFDADSHGQTGKRLVKLIKDEALFTGIYDYKNNGVGSSTSSGSSEWSDAEIMMMMNPTDYINTGFKTDNTATHAYTINASSNTDNYVVANRVNIFRNMGSYYNGGTIYLPARVTNGGFKSTTTGNFASIDPVYQGMIAETTWGTAGIAANASNKTVATFYAAERGSTTNNADNSVRWIGKIGLMYPSDYGYATSGIDTTSRSNCLTSYDMTALSINTDCVDNNWMRSVANANAASESDRVMNLVQWTMTPNTRYKTAAYCLNSNGSLTNYGVNTSRVFRPVLYLKDDTELIGGTGTWDDPFTLILPTYTVTYTDGVNGTVLFQDQVYNDVAEGSPTPSFVGTPTRNGYIFVGWSPVFSSTVTADVTYTTQWVFDARADLVISKQVTGNLAEVGEEFSFKITLSTQSIPLNQSFTYYIGSNVQANPLVFYASREAVVQVSSLNDVTIKDIPVGTNYTIEEIDDNDYLPTVSTQSGTIAATDNVVTFVNNKERSPLTGIFTCQMPFYLLIFISISGIIIIGYRNKSKKEYDV